MSGVFGSSPQVLYKQQTQEILIETPDTEGLRTLTAQD